MATFKLGICGPTTPYTVWEDEVNSVLSVKVGVNGEDLGVWPSMETYNAGKTVQQGAIVCLEAQPCCPRELINKIWSM
jgi:hypothetical protein